ncbi:hypothetical protein RHMOL_Rhmol11G0030800 [Rhododendron molle]|uniref:Uncharacterized protein n=1 Tax=Rhododendron molle TaxID=49168 RepID=A0ACC0LNB3_RHOML|nr:hypothetical protein RHMOL_Rhmol11G0030800 [Rhododendron molle]
MLLTFPLPSTCCWAGHGSIGIRPLKEDGTPVLKILHGEEDIDLGGFSFDTSGSVLAINVDGNFIISSVAMDIMRRMSFFPGLGLGIRQLGVPEFPTFPSCEGRFGLGYVASTKDAKIRKRTGKPRTLYSDPNIYFVRAVGNAAYTGQAEPFIDAKTGELLPGFEVFANDTWSSSDEEPAKAEFKRKLN